MGPMLVFLPPETPYAPVPFAPSRLLRHPHLQTVVGEIFPRRLSAQHDAWRALSQEALFEMPDGDRLQAFVHLQPDDPERRRPVVLQLHGLEGHAGSHYQVGLSAKAFAAGFHSVRLNFRNCGGTEHLARKLYSGRSTEDVREVLAQLRDRWGFETLYATGASLGANLLLRLLADTGEHPPAGLAAAVAVSPPIEMAACGVALRQGLNRGYEAFFLQLLKRKLRRKARLSPGGSELAPTLERLGSIRTLREFDDCVTAPLNGYADAEAYYAHASSADDLSRITVSTLIIHAQDDPFLPYGMYAPRLEAIRSNPHLTALFPRYGGHVGFLSEGGPRREPWMDERWAENEAIAYLQCLSAKG